MFQSSGHFDPVSGSWTGAWYRQGESIPAGALQLTMSATGPDTWLAVAHAASGAEAVYEFEVKGRREGSLVLFQGDVDLGRASGGKYVWNGEIDGRVFQGSFRHPSGDGRFELVRRPSPEPAGAGVKAADAPAFEPPMHESAVPPE
jgi:hypothetical protein